MRHRIDFDNKRQLYRYAYILSFLLATFCIMAYWDVDNEIWVPWALFTMLWVPAGQFTLSLFEDNERQFKYYIRIFCFLTIAICIMGHWDVDSEILVTLNYFTFAWAIGFSKIILRRLRD